MGLRLHRSARICRPELLFEQLEERIVLDAALHNMVSDHNDDLNVVITSSAQPNLPAILAATEGRAELMLYDSSDDLASMDAKLDALCHSSGKRIGVLAVVAHAAPAELTIGNERIDLSNVEAYRSGFEALAHNMADNGQIQLFGCSVAENDAGKILVDRIAAYTSAEVLASTDTTGGPNGNWILEYSAGSSIPAVPLFNPDAMAGVGPLANAVEFAHLTSDLDGSTLGKAFVEFNGEIYFSAADQANGAELRAYDPVSGVTRLVKDIVTGSDSSGPHELTVMNGALYFVASDGPSTGGLWKTDGTESGTVLLKEFPKSGGQYPLPFQYLTPVNTTLFFSANDGVHGWELWKSNGTAAGTVIVKDLWPGPDSSFPEMLTNFNGTLIFKADPVDGRLCSSNGTDGGTIPLETGVLVRDYSPDQTDWRSFPIMNGALYFQGEDTNGDYGLELWKTDGTVGGAVRVTDINSGPDSSSPHYLTVMGSTLYFSADDGVNGESLWKTQGTSATTSLVKEILAGPMLDLNGQLLIHEFDNTLGDTIWKSNGTPGGTVMVTDPTPLYYWPWWYQYTKVNDKAYFVMDDGSHGIELWNTDLTAAGTNMVQDIWSGSPSSYPIHLTNINGTLYFFANTPNNGYEPWKYVPSASANQPPVAGNFTVNNAGQETIKAITGWKFTDPDADHAQSLTITALPDQGTLFFDRNSNNKLDSGEDISTGDVIIWSDATTSRLVKYQTDSATIGAHTLKYTVTDTQGSQGTVAGTGTINVVQGPNDAPVNHVPSAQTIPEDTALTFSSGNGNAITISDADAGTEAVQVQLTAANGTISLPGTIGLTFSAGDGSASVTMTFTGTITAINTALDGMQYNPSSNYNGVGGSVTIVTNDLGNIGTGGAKIDANTILVNVTSVEDPPVAGSFSLSVDMGTVATVDGWSFTDPDSDHAQSITITLLPTHGTLFLDTNTDDIFDSGEEIALNQVITWADAKTSQLVKYGPESGYIGNDSLRYLVTDAEGTVSTSAATVTITVGDPYNDPPVNDVPSTQTTPQNTDLVFSTANSNAVSISDPDAGTEIVQVQLTAANGTLTLAGKTGLTFSTGDGTSDETMTFTGTISSINTALDGMAFRPTLNYSGSAASVTIVTDDLGHTGTDGQKTDTDSVTITVSISSDGPVAGDRIAVVPTSTSSWHAVTWIQGWTYTDPQNDQAGSIRVVSLPTHGTLFLDQNANHQYDAGEDIVAGQEIPWATVQSFAGIKYTADENYDGLDSFRYLVIDDSGNVGTYQGTCTIGVGPNDRPDLTVPGPQSVTQGGTLTFSSSNGNIISVADSDIGNSPIEVTIYSYLGTVSLGDTSGITLRAGDGIDDWVIVLRAPLDAANAALDGLNFKPIAGYHGPASIIIQSCDLGSTGVGGWGVAVDAVDVTIVAV